MRKKPRRFRIPKSIKIGKHRWKICIEPETTHFRKWESDGKTLEQERLYGICYRADVREIHLSKRLRGRFLEKVAVHELLHACAPTQPVCTYQVEEQMVDEMSGPVAEMITNLMRAQRRKHGRKRGR